MNSFYKLLVSQARVADANDEMSNKLMDRNLVKSTEDVLRDDLDTASRQGRYGWWCSKTISTEDLQRQLSYAFRRDDYVSIISLAAMLNARKFIGEAKESP